MCVLMQNKRNMTKSTITKFFQFVIFFILLAAIFSACATGSSETVSGERSTRYLPPKNVGSIADPEIAESSGLIASKCQPDVFWTHNDSGDDAFIYALRKTGAKLGTWHVTGAQNIDWEDIAGYKDNTGKCFIYIGEIGDNQSRRAEHVIYRIREPRITPDAAGSTRAQPVEADKADVIRFTYPDGNHDAETILVNPNTADIYVISKRIDGPAGVYRLRSDFGIEQVVKAEKVADLSVPAVPNGFLTGGDISPDGKHLAISDYAAGYEFTLPESAKNFDEIWTQEPEVVDLGKRKVGESVCYSPDGNAIYASSEGKGAPIYEIVRRR